MERRLAAILAADVVGYTRLMGTDEAGTLDVLKAHRRELIEPTIAAHSGRVVKLMGDGLLAEFASVVDAVECAVEIQAGMAARNAEVADDRSVDFRIGINLGDVIVEGEDIYGDGINVASRLEAVAEPGGICVSEDVYRQVAAKVRVRFDDLGQRQLKNLPAPLRVYRLSVEPGAAGKGAGVAPQALPEQDIRFCTTADGVRIAHSTVGRGPPLVKAANWMNHLEFDAQSPVWRHWIEELGKDHTLIRYDERGNGLSDWEAELTFEHMVGDLEAVVDALGLERFALLGISQGCAVSVAYAVRHPERVSRLVLYGGYVRGWRTRADPQEIEWRQALTSLIRTGWGQDNPAFRQVFTSLFMPEATPEQTQWFNDLQRVSTSPENAVRLMGIFAEIDVSDLLPQVRVPTLVLHCRNESIAPFDEGRRFASGIPNARFVPLESRNHLILPDEPAWRRFMTEVRAFLG
jgi:class 3 adenylate cyclase/pimeloyl-ACP methyl ester carboxylesterase